MVARCSASSLRGGVARVAGSSVGGGGAQLLASARRWRSNSSSNAGVGTMTERADSGASAGSNTQSSCSLISRMRSLTVKSSSRNTCLTKPYSSPTAAPSRPRCRDAWRCAIAPAGTGGGNGHARSPDRRTGTERLRALPASGCSAGLPWFDRKLDYQRGERKICEVRQRFMLFFRPIGARRRPDQRFTTIPCPVGSSSTASPRCLMKASAESFWSW